MIRQELWCHECSRYVVFEMDEDLSGDLTVICPNCGHEHYRVVVNGEITEVRWASSGGGAFTTTGLYSSTTSWTATVSNTFITASWHNTANLTFSNAPIITMTATASP